MEPLELLGCDKEKAEALQKQIEELPIDCIFQLIDYLCRYGQSRYEQIISAQELDK